MTKKFYAVLREDESVKWKPERKGQYLMLWDTGFLAVVSDNGYYGVFMEKLDNKKWKLVWRKECS